MRKMKRNRRGSFTVEITLIMPIVLMIILVLFFFVLYMYNRGIMQNAVCRGAKQVFYYADVGNSEIEKMCTRVVLDDVDDMLVGVKESQVKVKVSANQVEIVLTGQLNVPKLLAPSGTVFEDLWKYEIYGKEYRFNPAKMIRTGQQIKDIYDEVKPEVMEDGSEI